MKARKVKGLDPSAPLGDTAELIIATRLAELRSFMPRALDPRREPVLHDMRIAAKRLRYVLEVTGPCLGPYAVTATKRTKALQDLLGEIHDCDVMVPLVAERLAEMRMQDAVALHEVGRAAGELSPTHGGHAPNRASYRGLEVFAAHLQARRALLFERFLERWAQLEEEGFAERLRAAAAERSTEVAR